VDATRIASFFAWASDADERGDDPRTVLQRRFGDLGWVVPQGLAAAPEPEAIYFDIVAQVEMPRWHTGRVVLIGDAAYAVSLVAGQGASLGVAGGALLGEVLDGATDVPAALAAMEEGLRGVVEDKQRGGRRTAKWFLPETKLRVNLRNMALNVMASPLFARLLSPLFALDAKGFAAK
jgi:2-polyprenyl-6-methoxyphenol hydroxylase-like FAD-dependent oxidoreductase